MMESRVIFDLDEQHMGSTTQNVAANNDGKRRQGNKRKKYAAKACRDCKRRKVKCSGEEVCQQCWSRDVPCCYSPPSLEKQHAESIRKSHPTNEGHSTISLFEDTTSAPSTKVATNLQDSRVDELSDRVGALERIIAHLLKSVKGTEELSPGTTFQTPLRNATVEEDHDANQFALRPTAPHDDLSLSSQVAAMSALLSRPPSPKPGSVRQKDRIEVLIEFPEPPSLQHLLNVYFRDMDTYFPFLDRKHTESCLYATIRRLGYGSHNHILVATNEDLSTLALACMMLALAECVDPEEGACDGDAKPGWENYLQSCRAISRFSHAETADLNIIKAQCLVAAYLMHCELLGAASEAVYLTWKLATSIRLNNKNAWAAEDDWAIVQKQKLWWTIYFLDRQISRRSGIAYHIRDTEFDVEDFSVCGNTSDETQSYRNEWQSSTTRSYLQALISLARLWGQVWDTFFAVGATKKGDWMEVEIMDARILNTRRQLPDTLTWDADQMATYTLNGEGEPQIRRRLHLFTRLELLRMLIRQNPVRQKAFNPETGHLCARLSKEIINALDLFISRYPEARATGYFTTSSAVECIYHLVPVMRYSKDDNEHSEAVSAFNRAHSILVRLSVYNNVAKKALKALNGVIRKWGRHNTSANNGTGYSGVRHMELVDCNITDNPAQLNEIQGSNIQTETNGFNIDLGEWMNVSMGSLYGTQFDYSPDNQL